MSYCPQLKNQCWLRIYPIFRMSNCTQNFALRRLFCQNMNIDKTAKTKLWQQFRAFYHLWVVSEFFSLKQAQFIENSVNNLNFDTYQSCDRRVQNIGSKPENLVRVGL